MKLSLRWSALPTTIAAVFAMAGLAASQPIAVTSNSPVSLKGTSGGPKQEANCPGNFAASPNHTIEVTADSNLRFYLEGAGQPTLFITGPQGQTICLPADSLSQGKIELPGRWTKGTYLISIGDRAQGQAPYTLSISPHQ